ncbi:MAG: non-canonical purine NTP pyrophosphatase [Vicinamibacterales bacterium]
MKIYFVTSSEPKRREFKDFLASASDVATVEIAVLNGDLDEVLDHDIDNIVTHKALGAYGDVGLPCVVEHSGLFMDALPGLPGGLGQVIWKAVGERMCQFLRPDDSRAATARSVLGYCNGRVVHLFSGETRGHVAECARGEYAFNWDQIFIPDGATQTYGEMSPDERRRTSPAHKAWTKLVSALADELKRGPKP